MNQDQPAQNSQAFWQQHIQAQPQSGLTQQAYCDKHNIKVHRLWYWKNKLKPSTQGKKNGFATAQLLNPSLTLPGSLTISLPNGVQLSGIDDSNLALIQPLLSMLK